MENLKDKKVGSLVAENYRYADVFKKYNIDFCCGGGISVEEACRKHNLDYNNVINDLKSVEGIKKDANDVDTWELDRLIDHIQDKHHTYVRASMPLIKAYAEKVSKVHGGRHPELIEIFSLISELEKDLTVHLSKEEVILFPFIKKLLQGSAEIPSIENPIDVMLMEHDVAGDIMKAIARLSGNYQPPADACTTYNVLYQKLEEFESDLHRHVHLENNILFPKALTLEHNQAKHSN